MAIKAEWNGVIFALLYLCSLSAPAIAQEAAITADGTTATDVTTPDGSNFDINGGDRAGSNLFHSFGNFGVPNGGSANFLNPVDIANIISRVTGGKTSTIEGLIKANGSANLFLINPAGIIFGPNASLNIGGSFLGSTADSLLFPEGEFSATNLQTPPLLTINAPIGLNLRDNPSPISNNSQTGLQVQSGKNVSLVGGDVSLDGGGITAPGGRIELGGLTAAGTVGINNDSSLSFPDSVARSNVSLTNGAFVDVIGEGGGFITVNANNLEILDGSGLLAGIGAGVGSIGAQAGDITLNATDKITIQGDANSGLSAIGNVVLPIAKGNAGDIFVNTKTLEGIGSFQISSLTFGEGDAGKVSITATEKVSFDALGISGSGIGSAVYLTAKGNADDIIINTPSLSLSNSALLATSTIGKGNAGNIQINATDSISISGGSNLQAASYGSGNAGNIIFDAENAAITFDNATATTLTSGTGKGGDISIKGRSLSLTNGAQLSSSTFGEGNAGNVTIAADGAVNLVGGDIFSNVENQAVGNGGKITITAGELSLKDGAQLQTLVRAADTEQNLAAGRGEAGNIDINVGGAVTLAGKEGEGGSAIFSRLGQGGEGKAGDINIKAGSLSLADESVTIDSSTFGQGNAGNVTIAADGAVNLVGGDIFSNVENQAVGNGGKITITAGELSLKDGAQLQTLVRAADTEQNLAAGRGEAGNIDINVGGAVTLAGKEGEGGSAIFSRLGQGGEGKAGDINIKAGSLSLADESVTIDSSTFGQGNAGNVTIAADGAVNLVGGDIFSNVENQAVGNGGKITITAGELSLKDGAQLQTLVRAADTEQNLAAGRGEAGNIDINVGGAVTLAGKEGEGGSAIFSRLGQGGEGKAGDINIKAGSLSLADESVTIDSSTFGQGNAGNVTIAADGAVNLVGGDIFSNVENQAVGNGGKITITAGELSLKDGAQLQTLVRAADTEQNLAAGRGEAGNIDINVGGAVTLAGKEGEGGSAIFSRLGQGGEGKAGDINIKAGSLSLADEAVAIVSSTSGKGNAGNVTIAADGAVNLVGGNIFSNVGNQAVGDGGKIDITAKSLSLEGGAQLVAIVRGQDASIAGGKGNAGAINLNIADTVTISGQSQQGDRVFPSKVTSEIESGAEGRGGDINIKTRNLSLANDAVISSGNFGTGNGGNINLELQNTLKMRNNSTIEAQATGNNTAGNISINAPNGFVVAFPNQDNNIIATAEAGGGGQITINAKRIYGFDKERIQSLDRDNLFGNGENDINSTSADPKLSGNINLNIEQLDPAKERAKAPENVVEPDETVAQACDPENKLTEQNTFTIVGRGGMPPSPTEMLRSSFIQVSGGAEEQRSPDAEEQRGSDEEEQRGSDAEEQRGSDAEEQRGSDAEEQRNPDALSLDENKKTFSSDEVIPARGMMVNAQGQIVLTAYPTPNAGERTTPKSNYCSINREQATGSRQQSRPVVGEVLSISFRRTII
jgi:filamentous hemagglutinin family protein